MKLLAGADTSTWKQFSSTDNPLRDVTVSLFAWKRAIGRVPPR
jgi:hypothetical protein